MWSPVSEDDPDSIEESPPTLPTPAPDGGDGWEDCATLAERIVRLVGGGAPRSSSDDASRPVSVDAAIDRALAEHPDVRRALRRRCGAARVRLDAERLKDLFVVIARDVLVTTPSEGAYARAIAVHTELDARGNVVVEIADVRRVWAEDAEEAIRSHLEDTEAWLASEETNARATDAATGIVLSTTTHLAFGRLARIEIPQAIPRGARGPDAP
jgi:hypothetical protein